VPQFTPIVPRFHVSTQYNTNIIPKLCQDICISLLFNYTFTKRT